MFKFNTQRSLAIVILGLGAAAFPSLTYADHSWGSYHWARTSNPFTLNLGDNVSTTWDPYLGTTRSDWSNSSALNTAIVSGAGKRRCGAVAGRVEVCNSTYGNNGWLGIASISVSGSHITQGTVKLNDTYFNTVTYNSSAWRNLVTCQEVGHTLGLDHQDEAFGNPNLGTCMDYTSNPAGPPSNEHPNAHDYEELGIIYNHLDLTTTVASSINSSPSRVNGKPAAHYTPAVADEIDTSNPAEWGMLVSSTHGGWVETYERDLGANQKLVTFVIWAE